MVLSDRFSGEQSPSLVRRTVLYVLGFGLGALAFAAAVSFVFVSIAEGVLPDAPSEPSTEAGTEVNVIGDAPAKRPSAGGVPSLDGAPQVPSKGRRGRANQAAQPDAADDPI